MRLPRRTAFAQADVEIPHLFSLLYPPAHLPPSVADGARHRGVSLVQTLYTTRSGGCPVAIECSAALVAGVLVDRQLSYSAAEAGGSVVATLQVSIRQTLSLCVIRLVNSLADSLQKGQFARSIATIAEKELGLPQWLVEFRHRATHEDLPSLEVCREAVGACLAWLETNYWAPTLRNIALRQEQKARNAATHEIPAPEIDEQNSHPQPSMSKPAPSLTREDCRASLLPILQSYKRLSKQIVRDESLKRKSQTDLNVILRELEGWVERWQKRLEDSRDSTTAYDVLLTSLITPGTGFVPLAKAKRTPRGSVQLPEPVRRTWEPLLERLALLDEALKPAVLARIVDMVSRSSEKLEKGEQLDHSYLRTLTSWALNIFSGQEANTRVELARLSVRTLLLAVFGSLPADGSEAATALERSPSSNRANPHVLILLEELIPLSDLDSQEAKEDDEETKRFRRLVETVHQLGMLAVNNKKRKSPDASALLSAESKRPRQSSEEADDVHLDGFDQMDATRSENNAEGEVDDANASGLLRAMEERYAALLGRASRDASEAGDGEDTLQNEVGDEAEEVEAEEEAERAERAAAEGEEGTEADVGGEEAEGDEVEEIEDMSSEDEESETPEAGTDEEDALVPSSPVAQPHQETHRFATLLAEIPRLPQGWSIARTKAPDAHEGDGSSQSIQYWTPTPIGCLHGKVPDFLGLTQGQAS